MGSSFGPSRPAWRSCLPCILVAVSFLLTPPAATAQEPVASFDQLGTRVKPGNTVWVIDAQGREIKGKVRELGTSSLTVDSDGLQTLQADTIGRIERRSTRKKHALIGLAVGAAVGVVAGGPFAGEPEATGAEPLILAGIVGGIGAAVGAIFPGRTSVVYRAPGLPGSAHARLAVAPVVARGTKGVVVSFAF